MNEISEVFSTELVWHVVRCVHRDVSSAELLITNHQDIKAEIEARADSFTSCIEMGSSLLAKNHYASEEVSLREASPGVNQRAVWYHTDISVSKSRAFR